MNCQECQLALASEDRESLCDAAADQGAASHLAWCSACQEFAMELRENSAALRALGAEPMPALAPVRWKAPRYRPSAWWPAAAVVAAMLLLGFIMSSKMMARRAAQVLPEPAVRIEVPAGAQAAPAGTWQETRSPAPLKTLAAPIRRHAPSRSRQQNEPHILQVKMLTDDPDVVIYWQIEN